MEKGRKPFPVFTLTLRKRFQKKEKLVKGCVLLKILHLK